MTLAGQLKEAQERLRQMGVQDVKFFFSGGVRGELPSKVADDVNRLLRGYIQRQSVT